MQSRIGKWMMAAGGVIALMGLCVLPAGLGDTGDKSLLGLGASVFSFGILTIACGIYIKASALTSKGGNKLQENANSNRPIRGGCDRCHADAPVIQCKVHQQHLCSTCLADHYDFRTCAYAPSSRRAVAVKAMSARVSS